MEIKTCVVTGASSGIGKAIALMLKSKGYEVIGIGRVFEDEMIGITKVVLDLRDTDSIVKTITEISKKYPVNLLVNAAGCAYYGVHETLTPEKIREMCEVNLEAPMIITNLLLPVLRENKGTIVDVSSITADRINTHGASYGALKAAMQSFDRSLFEEYRKHGLKVVTLKPGMTDSNLYRNADFKASEAEGASLSPSDVADVVEFIVDAKDGVVPTEITVVPQYHRIDKKSPL